MNWPLKLGLSLHLHFWGGDKYQTLMNWPYMCRLEHDLGMTPDRQTSSVNSATLKVRIRDCSSLQSNRFPCSSLTDNDLTSFQLLIVNVSFRN